MLNIIIYEDNREFMDMTVKGVNVALADYNVDYRIHKFSSYNNSLKNIIDNKDMKKIYIFDVEVNGISGIELASMIRETDWNSIIIISTAYDKYKNDVFYTRLMVLDFISKYDGYEKRLVDTVCAAVKVVDKQKNLVFKYNYVLYRIPFDQICYIEKEPIVKRCIVHTNNNDFYVIDSISNILSKLDSNFCRTHQSCIVNLANIKRVDFVNNIIVFKNDSETSMLTDKMKKEVKKYVGIN